MSYTFAFTNAALNNKNPFTVPVGTFDTTTTDLTFTGKGAANFGQAQQTNLLRLLENFADSTEPANATVGQLWYDSAERTVKVCLQATPTKVWQELNGIQVTDVGEAAPGSPGLPPQLGDIWMQRTGTGSGFIYTFTGLGRYPTTSTTIGGWEQIWPAVEVYAGRDEYDAVRQILDRLCGPAVSTYGSGAIGRSITNLTDFGALDNDLRTKYKALGADAAVLISPWAGVDVDRDIVRQAPSNTLFYFADVTLSGADGSDGMIAGGSAGIPNSAAAGTILIDGVVTTVPIGNFYHGGTYDDGYIVWDRAGSMTSTGASTGPFFVVQQDPTTRLWYYDNNLSLIQFTPTANHIVIGTISTTADTSLTFPGDIGATMWAHGVPMVTGTRPKYEHLKVEPNSQDWDALLAAAKYAIGRLEVPPNFVRTVSQLPFVYDGRQVNPTLLGLDSATDIRYPSAARRAGRHGSSIGLSQSFAETINALNVGIDNRFSIRGINGASGTNVSLLPTASVDAGITVSGVPTIVGATTDAGFRISFSSEDQLMRWLGSGSAIRFGFSHVGGAGVGDSNLRQLFSSSLYVLTADKVRVFNDASSLIATQPSASLGLWNATVAGHILATYTNAASISIFASQSRSAGAFYIDITIVLTPNGVVAGNLSTTITLVQDHEGSVYPILTNSNLAVTNSF